MNVEYNKVIISHNNNQDIKTIYNNNHKINYHNFYYLTIIQFL